MIAVLTKPGRTLSSIKPMAEANLALGDAQTSLKSSVVLKMVAVWEAAEALRLGGGGGVVWGDKLRALDKALAALEE